MHASLLPQLLLTCEHAGKRVPPEYASLFAPHAKLLASHRGWDPGALPLAMSLARRLRAPLRYVRWTRLLVESNRSPGNPKLFSDITRALPQSEKDRILRRYWQPHRSEVERMLDLLGSRGPVVHVGIHTFTPVLDGKVREVDIGFLYDPSRPFERNLCRTWASTLAKLRPDLRIRMNRPYLGTADGLSTALRKTRPPDRYAGIELEVNQAMWNGNPGPPSIATDLAAVLNPRRGK